MKYFNQNKSNSIKQKNKNAGTLISIVLIVSFIAILLGGMSIKTNTSTKIMYNDIAEDKATELAYGGYLAINYYVNHRPSEFTTSGTHQFDFDLPYNENGDTMPIEVTVDVTIDNNNIKHINIISTAEFSDSSATFSDIVLYNGN